MDVDEIDSSTGLPEEEKYFTAIGFGSSIFRTTLGRLVEDSQETFKKELTKQIHEIVEPKDVGINQSKLAVFNKSQRRNETKQTIMALIEPLAELDLKIDNAAYEQYDAQDLFIADFISKLKKAIRQWK